MSKTPRIPLPKTVRDYVLQRDRHRCQSCGKSGETITLQIDHIIPLAAGGSNDLSNLQTLCANCNRLKSAKFDPRFRRRFT
ncbi:MAG: HNH endonuclease, partial [Microcystaceae cyanobacterium]